MPLRPSGSVALRTRRSIMMPASLLPGQAIRLRLRRPESAVNPVAVRTCRTCTKSGRGIRVSRKVGACRRAYRGIFMNPEAQQSPAPMAIEPRHFLLLQMPCGRFGRDLQRAIKASGHRCTRVAINGGDLINALRQGPIAYFMSFADWPSWIASHVIAKKVTDLICYGDCRPYHRAAIQALKPLGVSDPRARGRLSPAQLDHLRKRWRQRQLGVDRHRSRPHSAAARPAGASTSCKAPTGVTASPASVYYFWTLMLTPLFPRYQTHRDLDIVGEATLWLKRLPPGRSATAAPAAP